MSLTLEELREILAGPAGLDTEKDPATGVPIKLSDILAKINGVNEEKVLKDLAGTFLDDDGEREIPEGFPCDPDAIVVPPKYGKRGPLGTRPVIREAKTAQDIVDEGQMPQLNLATVIDAYIRLVIKEELDGGSGGSGVDLDTTTSTTTS
jgi:hypothetical protein